MKIKEIHVNKFIRKISKKDTLFHGDYILDPYQNCSFGCIYCDSTLDDTIYIKTNAIDILKEEIETLPNGRIIIGSVHDPYQPVENKYHLTHDILKVLTKTDFSVHILTKSTSILNDLALIKQVTNPIVTFTVLSLDKKLWKTIEAYTPSPLKRLQTMKTIANQNVMTGVAVIPTLPYLTDQHIRNLIHAIKKHQAAYLLHKPLFLQGEQKNSFLTKLKKAYPELYEIYQTAYQDTPYLSEKYTEQLTNTIHSLCAKEHLPTKIPI